MEAWKREARRGSARAVLVTINNSTSAAFTLVKENSRICKGGPLPSELLRCCYNSLFAVQIPSYSQVMIPTESEGFMSGNKGAVQYESKTGESITMFMTFS